jgi:HK97 family phage prohead protease
VIRKSFEAVETKAIDAERGLYSCVFSATRNEDRQGDVIEPGAFTKALTAKSSVPVVYAHVWNDINQVLGRTAGWKELPPGSPELPESLQAKGLGGVKALIQYEMDVPAGRVAATHTKNGNITDWSFAFDIDDGAEKYEDNVRHIKSIKEIYEVTLALIGANTATTTLAFKAMVEAEAKSDVEHVEFIIVAPGYDQALDELLEIASQAVEAPEPTQAKSNDEAFYRAVEAAILTDLSALTPSVPDYAKQARDDEPDFESFLTYPQQGVITRG